MSYFRNAITHYRKRPFVVETRLFDGTRECADAIRAWARPYLADTGLPAFLFLDDTATLVVPTLEGDMHALTGDIIIKGIKNEFYPCKPDIFAASYEPAPGGTFGVGVISGPGLAFGDVVAGLKAGKRYARAGWNGKGMFVFLVNGSRFTVNREPLLSILGAGTEVDYHAHIDMRTATGQIVPWLASQTDVLAEDWVEV